MQSKIKKTITIIAVCIMINFSFPVLEPVKAETQTAAQTASLFLRIEKESFLDSEYLVLDIMTQSINQQINAADINLNFDPNILSLDSINYSSSFCSLFIKEEINNQGGKTRIACGSPTNNSTSSAQIARLKFKKLQTGWAEFNFDKSILLGGNGSGANILLDPEIHRVYIKKS